MQHSPMIDRLLDEPQRLWRGLLAMHVTFGRTFTVALVAVMLALVIAAAMYHGPFVAVLTLVCVLLAIRAHDLGDELEDRTEFTSYWDGPTWSPEQFAEIQAQERNPHSYNRIAPIPARVEASRPGRQPYDWLPDPADRAMMRKLDGMPPSR